MNPTLNTATAWRIELAKKLSGIYAEHTDIRMIVLGGSPSKNLSDRYSDLDIVVYWDTVDTEWLEKIPLKDFGLDRAFFRKSDDSDTCLESYYLETLKADFGHTTVREWNTWTSQVIDEYATDQGLLGTIRGFLDSIPLYGEELVYEWKSRLSPYPEELAIKIVKENLRFFVKGCLLNQGYKRDDLLFFYDGLSLMFKRILNILGGLNRVYLSTEEPRWIAYELEHMKIKPKNTWNRMKTALLSPGEEAIAILEELIDETFNLVEKHMPKIKVTEIRRRYEQSVEACDARPDFPDDGI